MGQKTDHRPDCLKIIPLRVIPACRQAGAYHKLGLFTMELGGKI